MQFRKRASWGPRIRLTDGQIAKVTKIVEAAGLLCCVENCWTGSCYVTIYETKEDTNINGDPIVGEGDEIAKIRLSGHDEGRRQDSTHSVIGSKSSCLKSLWAWLDEIVQTTYMPG